MPAGKLLRRYHNASLAQRIVFWFLLMVLVPTLLLAFITDRLSSASLREKIDEQLITLVEAKANRLETYAYERTRAASVLGRVRRIANAAIALQNVGKDTLDKSELENDIRTVAYYFMENLGFTNFILLAPQGDVLFQTQDQLPLGGNLLSGPQRDSELAQVVKRAMTLLEPDISNFAMYPGMEQPLASSPAPSSAKRGAWWDCWSCN
ncbi:hypothetical protein [Methylogaea oryzae]|uniref:hypothetical protein n=1 Tax=Methylogaea oryzae TaxID=1295382 RepID=UPI0006CF669C|nr:hypothetical protein [Methylogaea oryzae]